MPQGLLSLGSVQAGVATASPVAGPAWRHSPRVEAWNIRRLGLGREEGARTVTSGRDQAHAAG